MEITKVKTKVILHFNTKIKTVADIRVGGEKFKQVIRANISNQ